jgi:neopullulanase
MIRKSSVVFFLSLAFVTLSFAAPTVRKVDPPNWYVGRGNPMLLLYGEGLSGAQVTSGNNKVKVQKVEASENGHYLFVWLDASKAKAGKIPLIIRTADGQANIEYTLDAARKGTDGLQGLAANDVLYLLMPDRFADGDAANNNPATAPNTYDRAQPRWYHGGDLKGVREKLPYLKDLGVTAVWMTPFVDNENTSGHDGYHGYGTIDMYAVDEHYGTLKDVQDLAATLHNSGMKLVVDWVANHTGFKHPWVDDPPTPTWFHGSKAKHIPPDYEFPPLTNIHDTQQHKSPITDGWFADILADLDQDDPHVATYLLQNAVWWAEQTGLDAFRLDTFPYASRKFWSEWHRQLHTFYPRLETIGENFNSDPTVVAYFLGGRMTDGLDSGLNTAFDFPMMSSIRDVIGKNAPVTKLTETLRRDWLYPNPYRLVPMLDNHDTNRIITELGGSTTALKNATALLLTIRGIPQLYYGDEIGMAGGGDPDCRRDFPGGFPGDRNNAFTAAGRTPEQQDVFDWTQRLLKLRQQHPALTAAGKHLNLSVDENSYVFLRDSGNDHVVVAFNNSDSPKQASFTVLPPVLGAAQTWSVLLGSGTTSQQNGKLALDMPAKSVTLIQAK